MGSLVLLPIVSAAGEEIRQVGFECDFVQAASKVFARELSAQNVFWTCGNNCEDVKRSS